MWYLAVLGFVCSYLLGNLNGAVIVSSIYAHDDVRTHGSGNAGLTNFIRTYGPKIAVFVILIDVGKALLACFASGMLLAGYGYYKEGVAVGALGVILGHAFPALLGFKGGKGILSGVTVACMLDWRMGMLVFGIFLVAYILTGYVSLGSVLAAATFGIGFIVFHHDQLLVMLGGIFMAALTIYQHRGNIVRLIKGQERKTNLLKKGKSE